MSIESSILAILLADATLVATLTGGIYSKEAIGKLDIDSKNPLTPAYTLVNQKNVLRPCLVVKVRSFVPTGRRVDVPGQEMGGRAVAEMWLYNEDSYTAILTARERIYTLLNMKTKANIGVITLDNRIGGLRDEGLSNAALLRDDYSIKTKIGD